MEIQTGLTDSNFSTSYLYMFLRYYRMYQSLISYVNYLYKFILWYLINYFRLFFMYVALALLTVWWQLEKDEMNKLLSWVLGNFFLGLCRFFLNEIMFFFFILCDVNADCIFNLFIYLISEAKYGDRSRTKWGRWGRSNLWFDIWLFAVPFLKLWYIFLLRKDFSKDHMQ